MRRVILLVAGCVSLIAGSVLMGQGSAFAAETYCNPVQTSTGNAVTSAAGQAVLHAGSHPCSPAAQPVAAVAPAPAAPQKFVISGDVAFDFNKSVIKEGAHGELNEIASKLKANPGTKVSVNGYTDGVGSQRYNLRLSDRRAVAVKAYLVEAGVPASSIQAHGFGKSNPVASNKTADGRGRNRRVEIVMQ